MSLRYKEQVDASKDQTLACLKKKLCYYKSFMKQ